MERVGNNSYNILESYYEKSIDELDERVKDHILGIDGRYIQGFDGNKLKERETWKTYA